MTASRNLLNRLSSLAERIGLRATEPRRDAGAESSEAIAPGDPASQKDRPAEVTHQILP